MRVIIIALISFSVFSSEVRIEVFETKSGKLIAADQGDDSIVNMENLDRKVRAKDPNINIYNSSRYTVKTTDITQKKAAAAAKKALRERDIDQLKTLSKSLDNGNIDNQTIRRILKRLIIELKK